MFPCSQGHLGDTHERKLIQQDPAPPPPLPLSSSVPQVPLVGWPVAPSLSRSRLISSERWTSEPHKGLGDESFPQGSAVLLYPSYFSAVTHVTFPNGAGPVRLLNQ